MECLTIKFLRTMKKNIILSYSAPEVEIFDVVAERGYEVSTTEPDFGLPGLGTDEGSWD